MKKASSVLAILLVAICIILLVGCSHENQNNDDPRETSGGNIIEYQTIDDPVVLSILSSYTLALDDYYDHYVRGNDVLVYIDAIHTLLEQADAMGINDRYPHLYQLMTTAYEEAVNGDLAAFIIHSNDLNEILSNTSSEAKDEIKIRKEALELLMDWRMNGYDDFSVLEAFGKLREDSSSTLGLDNQLYRIIDSVYTYGMCMDSNNKTTVDMAINILAYDDGSLQIGFIGDTASYVFNDNRYDYLDVFPVYDLASGKYGVYNIETNEYVLEPTLTYLSEPDASGYICAQYKGYYGCLNMFGEKIIGFMYDEPITFETTVATVRTNKKYGVVDCYGKNILDCKYDSIEILPDNEVIVANWPGGALGELYKSNLAYGAYTLSGEYIIPHSYLDYTIIDSNIYMLENTYGNSQWYDLYDNSGHMLFGKGTALSDLCSITLPGNYGISIGRSMTSKSNINGISRRNSGYWYHYITDSLEYLNDGLYQMEFADYKVSFFNEKGYAVASILGSREGSTQTRVVLDKNGEVLDEFAYIYTPSDLKALKNNRSDIESIIRTNDDGTKWTWLPTDANDYLYILQDRSGFGLYIRSRGTVVPCDYASMIGGTNLTIVKNDDTGLYGLYDGETLVLDIVYNKINYSDQKVIAKRGAEEIIYEPKF